MLDKYQSPQQANQLFNLSTIAATLCSVHFISANFTQCTEIQSNALAIKGHCSALKMHYSPLKILCNALHWIKKLWNAFHCMKNSEIHFASIGCTASRCTRTYTTLKCTVVCDFGGNYILRPPTVSMAVTNNYPPTPNWDSEQFWPKISHCTTQESNCFRWSSIELRNSDLGGKKWSGNSSKVNLEQM